MIPEPNKKYLIKAVDPDTHLMGEIKATFTGSVQSVRNIYTLYGFSVDHSVNTLYCMEDSIIAEVVDAPTDKRIPHAQRLFNAIMDDLNEQDSSNTNDKYQILRYLTNMLESEEAELYKKINRK